MGSSTLCDIHGLLNDNIMTFQGIPLFLFALLPHLLYSSLSSSLSSSPKGNSQYLMRYKKARYSHPLTLPPSPSSPLSLSSLFSSSSSLLLPPSSLHSFSLSYSSLGHPEFTPGLMKALLESRRGIIPDAVLDEVKKSREARRKNRKNRENRGNRGNRERERGRG